jgi:hypothetical protein
VRAPKRHRKGTPSLLADIALVAGAEAAAAVARAKGGRRAYFPSKSSIRVGRSRWLVDLLGEETAMKIASLFPMGHEIEVPLGCDARLKRLARAKELFEGGATGVAVAQALDCHIRTVRRYRRFLKEG